LGILLPPFVPMQFPSEQNAQRHLSHLDFSGTDV